MTDNNCPFCKQPWDDARATIYDFYGLHKEKYLLHECGSCGQEYKVFFEVTIDFYPEDKKTRDFLFAFAYDMGVLTVAELLDWKKELAGMGLLELREYLAKIASTALPDFRRIMEGL